MSVRWWPHTRDRGIASFRLRCLRIVEQLQHDGVDADLYSPGDPSPAVLVMSKRYDRSSMQHAIALRERSGARLLLDLCDNHFHFEGDNAALRERAQSLREACLAADRVIVASHALAEVVRQECPAQANVTVIPDSAELPHLPTGWHRLRHPGAEWRLRRLTAALRGAGVEAWRRLVWFGNHGSAGTEGGMNDLAAIRPELERAHAGAPLSLTVISNHEEKFRGLVAGWQLPCFYLPWHGATFSRALQLHGASVIPVRLNPFTRCKTNNRVATALLHGLNVLANRIPSYDEFSGCTVLDDWLQGLGPYLLDRTRRAADVDAGRRLLQERYSLPAIAAQWKAVVTTT